MADSAFERFRQALDAHTTLVEARSDRTVLRGSLAHLRNMATVLSLGLRTAGQEDVLALLDPETADRVRKELDR